MIFARGIDDRELNTETDAAKSISVNLNWGNISSFNCGMYFRCLKCFIGVRPNSIEDVNLLLKDLSDDLAQRMLRKSNQLQTLKAKKITLKVMRKLYEGEPSKYLGHGDCETFSKSVNTKLISLSEEIHLLSMKLMKDTKVNYIDLRGISISLDKLEFVKNGVNPVLDLFSKNGVKRKKTEDDDDVVIIDDKITHSKNGFTTSHNNIDLDALKRLPPYLRKEQMALYNIPAEEVIVISDDEENQIKPVRLFEEFMEASQIDPEFLQAIPTQDREEILKEIEAKNEARRIAKGKFPATESPPRKDQQEARVTITESQVDEGFLNEIPTQFRNEILDHLKKESHRVEHSKNNGRETIYHPIPLLVSPHKELSTQDVNPTSYSQIDKKEFEKLPAKLQQEYKVLLKMAEKDNLRNKKKLLEKEPDFFVQEINPQPTLANLTNIDDIEIIIKAWIQTCSNSAPKRDDVEMLKSYFKNLLHSRIDQTQDLILLIKYHYSKAGYVVQKDAWDKALSEVFMIVNDFFIQSSGSQCQIL